MDAAGVVRKSGLFMAALSVPMSADWNSFLLASSSVPSTAWLYFLSALGRTRTNERKQGSKARDVISSYVDNNSNK